MSKVLRLIGGIPTHVDEATSVEIYDESVTIGAGGLSSGTALSLPNGETYDSSELEVYLFGQRLEDVVDYNYVGSTPRTQVTFTFDLLENDEIRFRIDRGA